MQHDSKQEIGEWKKAFLVEKCGIAARKNPALAVASIGYVVGRDRWGQRVFLTEEDVKKLGSNANADYAEVLHVVDGVSHDVQIFRDPLEGEQGEPGMSITGLEDVYVMGSYLRKAADATTALRDILSKLAWGPEYWAREVREGTCPPLEIRKAKLPGIGPLIFSYCLVCEDNDPGRAIRRWLRREFDWAAFGTQIGSKGKVALVSADAYKLYLKPQQLAAKAEQALRDTPECSNRTMMVWDSKNFSSAQEVELGTTIEGFLIKEGWPKPSVGKLVTLTFMKHRFSPLRYMSIICRGIGIFHDVGMMLSPMRKWLG